LGLNHEHARKRRFDRSSPLIDITSIDELRRFFSSDTAELINDGHHDRFAAHAEEHSFAEDLAAIAKIDVVPMILDVACQTTGLRFAAVARVTEDRWNACAVRDGIALGLEPGGELRVETTICNEVRDSGQLVVIDNVMEDKIFREHPTPKMYGFQSYISVPIQRPDGRFFGTLCALDPKPAMLKTPQIIGMFKLFAALIGFHLDAQERLLSSELALRNSRQDANLREQFIAVLGHDLRNPLNSISLGVTQLLGTPLNGQEAKTAELIRRSAARMAALIDNVLDFARSRMGDGFTLNRTADPGLAAALEQVIAEVRTTWPDRNILCEMALPHSVVCDSARIAQLFSNLLVNAVARGDPASPVNVYVRSGDHGFELAMANRSEPLPAELIERLFQPFSRASFRPGQQGLGLGLYIASEIARAHGGTLTVASSAEETRFTFRMPLDEAERPA
jgi:signal transduction histidine kinase